MPVRNQKILSFLSAGIDEVAVKADRDPFWQSLRNTGTMLWLDTGDLEEAEANWTAEMSALTTNNTLLNNEIQKGIYDSFIAGAKSIVKGMSAEEKVKEIAFMLNARHGLRLAAKFGGYVSVELHTDTAHDIKAIEYYGKRYHAIDPAKFIVKVPYTSSGLLGARLLRNAGVKINFTLEFSARENVLVTRIARPDYLNVFLGRIGAYISGNKLGDGSGAGEMTVLSAQKWVSELSALNPWPTKLIAASLRSHEQLELLAGTDIYTMPPKVAAAGRKNLGGSFTSRRNEIYPVNLSVDPLEYGINKFWDVDDKLLKMAADLSLMVPANGPELEERVRDAGFGDMFPLLNDSQKTAISTDGKIPVHSRWEQMIKKNEIAPDTLLTLAGLASFTDDQAMLDKRIRDIIG